jgi:hypothetical protein
VQFVLAELDAQLYGGENEFSNAGLLEVSGAVAGLIEETIHGDEGFARSEIRRWERAICWKAVVQAEGDEQRLTGDVKVGEPASFQDHVGVVRRRAEILTGPEGGLRGRRRPGACPTNSPGLQTALHLQIRESFSYER